MRAHPIELRLTFGGAEAMALSLRSILEVLATTSGPLDSVADRCPGVFDRSDLGTFILREDCDDLVRCEAIDAAATGASKLQGLQILPGNGYLLLCAALASDGHADAIRFVHGWPILSAAGNGGGQGSSARAPKGAVA